MIGKRDGFTLIEVLIVTVIIAILAAMAIPKFAGTKEKAYDASALADMHQLIQLSEGYFADHLEYPTTLDDLTDYVPSKGIVVTRFNREITDGVLVVHIHIGHQSSSHYFHTEYPVQEIEKRDN